VEGCRQPLALFRHGRHGGGRFLHYIGIRPNETDEGDEEAARRDLEKTP